jgi:hypothetical protein
VAKNSFHLSTVQAQYEHSFNSVSSSFGLPQAAADNSKV